MKVCIVFNTWGEEPFFIRCFNNQCEAYKSIMDNELDVFDRNVDGGRFIIQTFKY